MLVVVHTPMTVLLLRRADVADFWQSVTGSLLWHETSARQAAERELREETGLTVLPGAVWNALQRAPQSGAPVARCLIGTQALRDLGLVYRYPILPQWRARYAPGVMENTEYIFALELAEELVITVNPAEHADYGWFPFHEAAKRAASWTNREAIEKLNNLYR